MKNSYYGEYAYRSTHPRNQSPQTATPKSGYSSRLPWGNTQGYMPMDYLGVTAQKLALAEDNLLNRYQPNIPEKYWAIYNHEYLQNHGYRKLSVILYYLLGSSKAMAYFFSIIGVITFLVGWLATSLTFVEMLKSIIQLFFIIPGIFYYLWALAKILDKYCPQIFTLKAKNGLKWRLNRRTGMVSKFTYQKEGKVIEQTAPFDEFDGYLLVIPHRHGFAFSFVFSHRYEGWEVPLGQIVGAFTTEGTIKNGWEFLQDYMDITKPLPEIPVLEAYRHLDPVTAEYDKQTDRNPRRLRDMPEEEISDLAAEFGDPYNKAMNNRPCLFSTGGYVKYYASCEPFIEPLDTNQSKG